MASDSTVITIAQNSDGLPTGDTFTIFNDACPGLCTLTSGQAAYGWDERKGYGLTGATLVPTGDPLAVHVFRVEVWAGSQWTAFLAFAAKYLSAAVKYVPGTKTPRALPIYHPILSQPPFSITEVVVDHVTVPTQDDNGLWSLEISFKQYRKPVLALGKAELAVGGTQQPQPTAQDQAEAEFADKTNTFGQLARQL